MAPGPCTEPATVIFEVYSSTPPGGLYGELVAAVYACSVHAEDYRKAVLAARLTPFRQPAGITRRCGRVFDFDALDVTTWAEWVESQ